MIEGAEGAVEEASGGVPLSTAVVIKGKGDGVGLGDGYVEGVLKLQGLDAAAIERDIGAAHPYRSVGVGANGGRPASRTLVRARDFAVDAVDAEAITVRGYAGSFDIGLEEVVFVAVHGHDDGPADDIDLQIMRLDSFGGALQAEAAPAGVVKLHVIQAIAAGIDDFQQCSGAGVTAALNHQAIDAAGAQK